MSFHERGECQGNLHGLAVAFVRLKWQLADLLWGKWKQRSPEILGGWNGVSPATRARRFWGRKQIMHMEMEMEPETEAET